MSYKHFFTLITDNPSNDKKLARCAQRDLYNDTARCNVSRCNGSVYSIILDDGNVRRCSRANCTFLTGPNDRVRRMRASNVSFVFLSMPFLKKSRINARSLHHSVCMELSFYFSISHRETFADLYQYLWQSDCFSRWSQGTTESLERKGCNRNA